MTPKRRRLWISALVGGVLVYLIYLGLSPVADVEASLEITPRVVTMRDKVVPAISLNNVSSNSTRRSSVVCRLYVDGRLFREDRMRLPNPGRTETLTMTSGWLAEKEGNVEFKLIADENHRLKDPNRQNNTQTVIITVRPNS